MKVLVISILGLIMSACIVSLFTHGKFTNKIFYKSTCEFKMPYGWSVIKDGNHYLLMGHYNIGDRYVKQYSIGGFSPYAYKGNSDIMWFMDSCNAKGALQEIYDSTYFDIDPPYAPTVDTSFTNEMKRSSDRINRSLHYVSMCNKIQNEIIDAYQEDNPSKANRKIKLYNKYVDSLHKN